MSETISRELTTDRPVAIATYQLECDADKFHEIVTQKMPNVVISGELGEPKKIVPKADKVTAFPRVDSSGKGGGMVEMEYPQEFCGLSEGIPQLLNVTFIVMAYRFYDKIRLTDLKLPIKLVNSDRYKGPRFGVDGIRKLFEEDSKARSRPLLSFALPIAPLEQMTKLAGSAAAGGVDFISDHILMADPIDSELNFGNRIRAVSEAVERGQKESGKKTIYIANLTGDIQAVGDHLTTLADSRGSHHVGGILLNAFAIGFAGVKELIDQISGRFPVFLNMQGNAVMASNQSSGVDEGVLRLLCRLIGGDAIYLSSVESDFWWTSDKVELALPTLRESFGKHKASFGVATGSINITNAHKNIHAYGKDVILEVGRGIYKSSHRDGSKVTAQAMLRVVENISPEMSAEEMWRKMKELRRDRKYDKAGYFDFVCREWGLNSLKHFGVKDEEPV